MSEQDIDRISNLPDEILIHILSYLPTKYAVSTRILSTKWKYLYTFVPVLNFFCPLHCYTPATVQPFLDFVSFVFTSYNVDRMDKFAYSSSSFLPESEGPRIASWIEDSVNRRVRELEIAEILIKPQKLSQNVLTSETLTILKLYGDFKLDVPENVGLPRLRSMDLLSVSFPNDDSIRRLFRSCPVLEELFLNTCQTNNIKIIDICVPSLVCLKIHGGTKDEFELVLDVPSVKYFEYRGFQSLGFTSKDGFKSLVKACVSFPAWSFLGFEALPKLFSIVSHVQHLHFDTSTLESFQRYNRVLPAFQNLTSLEMGVSASYGFDLGLLVGLLDKTPNLGVLVLDNMYSSMYEPSDAVPEHVPSCVSENLKVIEFRRFSMSMYEQALLQYFLKNAKVLLKLIIQMNVSLEKKFEISKKVLSFPRCSGACQIFIGSVAGRRK